MTNPTEKPSRGVARGHFGKGAPHVSAKASNEILDHMLALARDNDIPLHNDADLAELLSQVRLDSEIPTPLYQSVAAVLAFVYAVAEENDTSATQTRPG